MIKDLVEWQNNGLGGDGMGDENSLAGTTKAHKTHRPSIRWRMFRNN